MVANLQDKLKVPREEGKKAAMSKFFGLTQTKRLLMKSKRVCCQICCCGVQTLTSHLCFAWTQANMRLGQHSNNS